MSRQPMRPGKVPCSDNIPLRSNSLRRHKPFVAVNVLTFAHDLVASELFGYAPGTFTGGVKEGKVGLLKASHRRHAVS